jgi:hypothetical protein
MDLDERPTSAHSLQRGHTSDRSKLSNNLFHLPGFHGKSEVGRRYRDLVRGFLADMGLDEAADLADTLKLQIRNTAMLALNAERLQARAAQGEAVDLLALIRMQNSLARALNNMWALSVGKRKGQTFTPDDALDYAKSHKGGRR